jgi:hypothetical protein
MKPGLRETLRSRQFALLVHLGLWALLIVAVLGMSGTMPPFGEAESFSNTPQTPVPAARLAQLFTPANWPKSVISTNTLDPFYTRHFIPPQPPAPTTRKFELTYQGFYQSEGGAKQTMIKIGDGFVITPVGGRVLSNLFAADATMQTLLLTNAAAGTNLLTLNAKKEVEVPIR